MAAAAQDEGPPAAGQQQATGAGSSRSSPTPSAVEAALAATAAALVQQVCGELGLQGLQQAAATGPVPSLQQLPPGAEDAPLPLENPTAAAGSTSLMVAPEQNVATELEAAVQPAAAFLLAEGITAQQAEETAVADQTAAVEQTAAAAEQREEHAAPADMLAGEEEEVHGALAAPEVSHGGLFKVPHGTRPPQWWLAKPWSSKLQPGCPFPSTS